MPLYIGLFKWTDHGVRNVHDAVTRVEQSRGRLETLGGRAIGHWSCSGRASQPARRWPPTHPPPSPASSSTAGPMDIGPRSAVGERTVSPPVNIMGDVAAPRFVRVPRLP
jgi:hypothetical protein